MILHFMLFFFKKLQFHLSVNYSIFRLISSYAANLANNFDLPKFSRRNLSSFRHFCVTLQRFL